MTAGEALRTTIDRVITSPSRRKLVVAGPGTGKTSLFKELLYASGAGRDDHLVLTFINTLRNDLEEQLHEAVVREYDRLSPLNCLRLVRRTAISQGEGVWRSPRHNGSTWRLGCRHC